jgi:hypothetical protein
MIRIRVTTASRGVVARRMSADRIPASCGIAPLADIPDGECCHGPPELVVECKHPVIPVPVLARRRHEIREPVEKLKGQGVDDAVRPRSRGRSRAARADPVGGFVSGEHVADAGDAAACVTRHRESLERKGWPGARPQQVFEALEIARHIAVDERDPDTGVDGKPAVLPGEHVGCGSGVEQVSEPEPADHAVADLLGESDQVGAGDRPHR